MDGVVKHVNSKDITLWNNNIEDFLSFFETKLTENNIKFAYQEKINFFNWDVNNEHIVVFGICDIFDEIWFDDLINTSKQKNLHISFITDNVFTKDKSTNNVDVIFVEELLGVYYNSNIKQQISEQEKLYTCLMQRTTFPRLQLYLDLKSNDLLDLGNVSLLGYQLDGSTSSEVLDNLVAEFNLSKDQVADLELPFRNFTDKDNAYEIEQNAKYNIVCETYNDYFNDYRISYSEKTFRALQIPNIALLLNKKGSNKALLNMGFKTHSFNLILDNMEKYQCQNKFLIAVLQNNMSAIDDVIDIAIHNSNKLKNLKDNLNDKLVDRIIKNIC